MFDGYTIVIDIDDCETSIEEETSIKLLLLNTKVATSVAVVMNAVDVVGKLVERTNLDVRFSIMLASVDLPLTGDNDDGSGADETRHDGTFVARCAYDDSAIVVVVVLETADETIGLCRGMVLNTR